MFLTPAKRAACKNLSFASPKRINSSTFDLTKAIFLVVDDFVTNRMVACEILRHLGHRCDMAADGAEAVVKAATQYYDAILMDLHMPKLGGIAAARQIRAAESGRGHRVPIVALTVEVDSKVHAECREAGMDGVLTKPFHIAEVEQVLASFPAGPA